MVTINVYFMGLYPKQSTRLPEAWPERVRRVTAQLDEKLIQYHGSAQGDFARLAWVTQTARCCLP